MACGTSKTISSYYVAGKQVYPSPFWAQVWGLPFEFMSEEVGKDIGGTIGNFLEVDK